MRELILSLDALAALREVTGTADVDVSAAAIVAELAGVHGLRLGIDEKRRPVSERDVAAVRRAAHSLELRMPATPALVKVALEARPDRVLLAVSGAAGPGPLDLRSRGTDLGGVVRTLAEAGIPAAAWISPEIESVKVAHAEGAVAVEFFTGGIADLPAEESAVALERLGDAVRLASKLDLGISAGGGLGYRNLPGVLEAAPAVGRVAVGRAAHARALLVGLDRALRDLQSLLA